MATSRPKTSKEKVTTTRRSARPTAKATTAKSTKAAADEGENYVSPESNRTPVKPVIEQPLRNMLLQEAATIEQEDNYHDEQDVEEED